MSLTIERPGGGPDVTRRNKRSILYIIGDDDSDGSIRFFFTSAENQIFAQIQKRIGNKGTGGDQGFELTGLTFSASSINLGLDMVLSSVAGFLETFNPSAVDNHPRSLIPHITFDESGTGEPHIPVANAVAPVPLFVNKVSESLSTLHDQIYTATVFNIIDTLTFAIGATVPTETVTIRVYIGTDNSGFLIDRRNLAPNAFTADSPIEIDYKDDLGVEGSASVFVELTSNSAFSMDLDAGGNLISSVKTHELRELEILTLNMVMKNDAGQVIKNDGSFVLVDYFEAAA